MQGLDPLLSRQQHGLTTVGVRRVEARREFPEGFEAVILAHLDMKLAPIPIESMGRTADEQNNYGS